MLSFLLRRLLFAALLVFVVSSAALLLARAAPGDFAIATLGPGATREQLQQAREQAGLTPSIGSQYLAWIGRAVRLDFGQSLVYGRPVRDLVPERAANTALLAGAALVVATLIGLPLGVITGSRPRGIVSALVRACSVVLLSVPPLLMSLLLIFAAAQTGWLPIGGMRSTSVAAGGASGAGSAGAGLAALLDLLRHMVVPVLALALPIVALFERLQSQALHDCMHTRFVTAARARGIPRRRIVWREAFKASLTPVLSVYGVVIGSLLSGSFAVEVVSAWPGLGRLMLDALRMRDVYLVAGCAAAGSLCLALGAFVSDVAMAAADPRIRE